MSAVTHSFDATQDNFETDVLKASLNLPVLVDFWAPWCGPCQSLGPILEKIVDAYGGKLRLAKVNTDEQMQVAGAFGIKSLPTVVLLKGGQIVDGFMGAQSEAHIREFLERHLGPAAPVEDNSKESPIAVNESPEQAVARLREAIAAMPDSAELKLDLAHMLTLTGEIAAATAELDNLPANLANDARVKRLRAEIDFAETDKNAPETAVLRNRVKVSDTDFAAYDMLGVRLIQEGETSAGLEAFLHILRTQRDWQDGLAKKRLLGAFNLIEDADLVGQYRRKMAAALF